MTAFLDALRGELPDLRLLTDETDRESYRRDETAHYEPGLPLAVALPTETSQVATIMQLRRSIGHRSCHAGPAAALREVRPASKAR